MSKELHDKRWPWCPWGGYGHTHTESLNDGPRVNGQKAGPMWELRDRVTVPPTAST